MDHAVLGEPNADRLPYIAPHLRGKAKAEPAVVETSLDTSKFPSLGVTHAVEAKSFANLAWSENVKESEVDKEVR